MIIKNRKMNIRVTYVRVNLKILFLHLIFCNKVSCCCFSLKTAYFVFLSDANILELFS